MAKKFPLKKNVKPGSYAGDMPDPDDIALLGYTLEYKWRANSRYKGKKDVIWSPYNKDWFFIWSEKYKAIITERKPKSLKKTKKPKRSPANKVVKRFKGRDPDEWYEYEVYDGPMYLISKAVHIIYKSNKWERDLNIWNDYIHEMGIGGERNPNKKNLPSLWADNPSPKKAEFFVCQGGKLTLTERGLVF